MRSHRHFTETLAWAKHQSSDQSSDTCVDVNDSTTSEVDRTLLEQESGVAIDSIKIFFDFCRISDFLGNCVSIRTIPVPNHVRNWQVSESEPQDAEYDHCREFKAFCKATTDQGNSDCREGQLEHAIHEVRDVLAFAE